MGRTLLQWQSIWFEWSGVQILSIFFFKDLRKVLGALLLARVGKVRLRIDYVYGSITKSSLKLGFGQKKPLQLILCCLSCSFPCSLTWQGLPPWASAPFQSLPCDSSCSYYNKSFQTVSRETIYFQGKKRECWIPNPIWRWVEVGERKKG